MKQEERGIDRSRLIWGAVLLVVGLALTFRRLDLAPLTWLYPFWPLGLVAAGLGLAMKEEGKRREGAWIAFIGLWLLVNNLGVFGPLGLRYATSWPLLVIFAGIVTLTLPKPDEDRTEGLMPIAVGLWLQANTLHLFGLEFRRSWPLLLVLLGLVLVARALHQARQPATGSSS